MAPLLKASSSGKPLTVTSVTLPFGTDVPEVRERSNEAEPSDPKPSVTVFVSPSPKTTLLPTHDGAPAGLPSVCPRATS